VTRGRQGSSTPKIATSREDEDDIFFFFYIKITLEILKKKIMKLSRWNFRKRSKMFFFFPAFLILTIEIFFFFRFS
jgi:hypothetical protein